MASSLEEILSIKLAAATIVLAALAFATTIYMSLNSGMRTYPIVIAQHSFSVSNITEPIAELHSSVWDAELKFSQNSGLQVYIKRFQGIVYYPKFKPLWCAEVKPLEIEPKRPNGIVIRLDLRGCGEELGVKNEEALKEVSLEMKMDLVVPYQFGKTSIWGWVWGLSVEEECSGLRLEFVSANGKGKIHGEGGWCFIPLPDS